MSLRPSRRAILSAVVAGLVLHTVTALWVWRSWGYFGRANVLTWIDFPVSLTYVDQQGEALLAASLVVGGLQWAAIAALLTLWVGRTVHGRRNSARQPPG